MRSTFRRIASNRDFCPELSSAVPAELNSKIPRFSLAQLLLSTRKRGTITRHVLKSVPQRLNPRRAFESDGTTIMKPCRSSRDFTVRNGVCCGTECCPRLAVEISSDCRRGPHANADEITFKTSADQNLSLNALRLRSGQNSLKTWAITSRPTFKAQRCPVLVHVRSRLG